MSKTQKKKINYAEEKGYKQIRNYKLFDPPIGKGATGVVYKAWNDKSKSLVAIKSIDNKLLIDERKMKAFQSEVKALHSLKHENIIKIFSVEKTINNIYIALEYCNCDTLTCLLQYFKDNYFACIPEALVQQILKQVIEGLSFMHQNKHMHRDLKMDNVLVHFPGEYERDSYEEYEQNNFNGITIKIADLGYAKDFEGIDLANTLCGTPIFMGPELVMNHIEKKHIRGYNMKADLWSLGALTYEMLMGEPPFSGNNLDDLFQNISKGKYNYSKNCMISLEAISFINGLLTFNEENRFSFKEMKEHPFLKNHPSTFKPLDLNMVPLNQIKNNKIEIDTKDMGNFLWVMYRCNELEQKALDKIKTNDLQDQDVMKSVFVLNENIPEDKKNILGRWRTGNKNSINKVESQIQKLIKESNFNNNLKDDSSPIIPIPPEKKNLFGENSIQEENNSKDDWDNDKEKIVKENIPNNVENKNEDKKVLKFNDEIKESKGELTEKQITDLKNNLMSKSTIDNNNNKSKIGKINDNQNQLKESLRYSSYIQLDNREQIEKQVEDNDILEILSCYSLLNYDENFPKDGKDVEIQSFIEIDIKNEHF